MRNLFENSKINSLLLKNRFIMAAANDNCDTKTRIERFSKVAEGEVGLIISGGQTFDEILSWKDVIEAIHDKGGKIALQIVNDTGGRFGYKDHDEIAVSLLDEEHVFFQNPYVKYSKHHEATQEEIEQIISFYAKAAHLAKSIGSDAIEIHSAHQSFLSHFLSPLMNKRKDKWGGSIENRTRVHFEIIKAIRAKVGNDYPVLIKLGVQDAFTEGLKFEEGKKIALKIAEFGYDALEISQGLQDLNGWQGTCMRTLINSEKDEGYYKDWCIEIKKLVSIPVVITGGLRSFGFIKSIIENNEADFIGLCRPLIREPYLIKRWKNNDLRKAFCISCNKCITELLMKGLPLECYLDKKF
ncbi:MAG: NADH:flavin oxidoreductase [Parachlamydiales bacterium]|nr:NADH:flavin oxidoreductase [Parachlamydiales bacterium]